jgi:hypothetical protein
MENIAHGIIVLLLIFVCITVTVVPFFHSHHNADHGYRLDNTSVMNQRSGMFVAQVSRLLIMMSMRVIGGLCGLFMS